MKLSNFKLLSLFAFLQLFAFVKSALLGIDYGNDYLKAVLIAPNVPFEIVLTPETKRKEPLSMAIKEIPDSKNEYERFYGYSSLPMCSRFPNSCVSNLKQLLGLSYDDNLQKFNEFAQKHPGVSLAKNKRRNSLDFKLSKNSLFSAEEMNAMILSQIKLRAEKTLKEETGSSLLQEAVITVPSFFTQDQRLAIIDSAKIAGFTQVKLVEDGVAVAINFISSLSNNEDLNSGKKVSHVIFDVGAGSTKASLVSIAKDLEQNEIKLSVDDYAFDESLGGELLTQTIFELLQEKLLGKFSAISESELSKSTKSLVKLWQAAEKAKLILSANNEASVSIESVFGDYDFRTSVSRTEFEEAAEKYNVKQRISKPMKEILKSIELDNIKSVILFGGSTRVPFIQKELADLVTKEKISKNVNSDEAAVQGATLRGVNLFKMFRSKNIEVSELSASEFSAEIISGKSVTNLPAIFAKGSSYGNISQVDITDVYKNAKDGKLEIKLFENDVLLETDSLKNAASEISKVKEKCETSFEVGVFFKLDESRIFSIENVTAKCTKDADKKSGGFFGSILNKEKDNDDDAKESETSESPNAENDTNSSNATSSDSSATDTKSKSKTKNAKVALSFSKEYATIKHLTNTQKDVSQRKLSELYVKDLMRTQTLELLNTMESELYSLRSTIEDKEDDTSLSVLEKRNLVLFKTIVTEYLEWLEEQTYNLQKVVKSKIHEKINKINLISKAIESPLYSKDLKILEAKIVELNEKIQTHLSSLESENQQMLTKYTEQEFSKSDFDKDISKIKKTAMFKIEELNLENQSLELMETLEKLSAAISDTEKAETSESVLDIDDLSQDEGESMALQVLDSVESYIKTNEKLSSLTKLLAKVEKEQKRRAKLFEKMLEIRIKKRSAKTSSKTESAESAESTDSTASEESAEPTSAKTQDGGHEHDEL